MATPNQILVSSALEKLKLKEVPPPEPRPGAPSEFEVTDETLTYLKGKKFEVNAAGEVTEK